MRLRFQPGDSIGAVICFLGGLVLARVLSHVLPRLGVAPETSFYCALVVLLSSIVVAIVLQLRSKFRNP